MRAALTTPAVNCATNPYSAGMISAALEYVAKHNAVCLEETLKNNRADSKLFASEF
jgi:hypothetical protein